MRYGADCGRIDRFTGGAKAINEHKLIIADTKILLRGNCLCKSERLGSFASEYSDDCDLFVECGPYCDRSDKKLSYREQNVFFWHDIPGGCRLEVRRPRDGSMRFAFDVDEEWRRASIYRCEGDNNCLFETALGEVLFRNAMISRGGIQIHSAAIAYKGKSILFSAPSETGKTTQARFWVNKFGASVINGDRPVVLAGNDNILACGTPWIGSDPMYCNVCLPVTAIVFLEQAHVNEVEMLSLKEAANRILPRCFLPYFSPEMITKALTVVDVILKRTRCYLLRCKPEAEAAELLRGFIE